MARTPTLSALHRLRRIAAWCDRHDLPSAEGCEMARDGEVGHRERRRFLADTGRGLAVAGLIGIAPGLFAGGKKGGSAAPSDVGIIGAGLAGLAAADELRGSGLATTVYEGNDRIGGRCHSARGLYPGQTGEFGGEFIDTLHHGMRSYANAFDLTLEDINKVDGEVVWHFQGRRWPEAQIVDEYRDFVATMHADLRASSGAPTADDHNHADLLLDATSLAEYLDGANALGLRCGPVAREAIEQAYVGEYGMSIEEQSCLNFLLFIHADKRNRFTPFGVFSDERFHVVEGNDRIAQGIADRLAPGTIRFGKALAALRKDADGRIRCTFSDNSEVAHDHLIIAAPFTALRKVALDASLGIPAEQRFAIDTMGYGANAKIVFGMTARPWAALIGNGLTYSDQSDFQIGWESSPQTATADHAIYVDYASDARARAMDPGQVHLEAHRFMAAADRIHPGMLEAVRRVSGGGLDARMAHWPSNPWVEAGFTSYRLNQFTTVAGLEGRQVGNLHFAGEHADSFYEWQGFMEGALRSGFRAAGEVLAALKGANA